MTSSVRLRRNDARARSKRPSRFGEKKGVTCRSCTLGGSSSAPGRRRTRRRWRRRAPRRRCARSPSRPARRRRREAEQRAVADPPVARPRKALDSADRAAVRDDERGQRPHRDVGERRRDPLRLLGDRLATREAERRIDSSPARVPGRILLDDVGDQAARPSAGIGLDEALVEDGLQTDLRAGDPGGLLGAQQRACVQRAQPLVAQGEREGLRLRPPTGVELVSRRPWKRAAALSSVSPWRTSRTSFEPAIRTPRGG